MRSILARVLVFASCFATILSGQTASQSVPKDHLTVEQKFREAQLKSDADAMAAILTDDFIRSPQSLPETSKIQYVEAIRSRKQKYVGINVHEARYRV